MWRFLRSYRFDPGGQELVFGGIHFSESAETKNFATIKLFILVTKYLLAPEMRFKTI